MRSSLWQPRGVFDAGEVQCTVRVDSQDDVALPYSDPVCAGSAVIPTEYPNQSLGMRSSPRQPHGVFDAGEVLCTVRIDI